MKSTLEMPLEILECNGLLAIFEWREISPLILFRFNEDSFFLLNLMNLFNKTKISWTWKELETEVK